MRILVIDVDVAATVAAIEDYAPEKESVSLHVPVLTAPHLLSLSLHHLTYPASNSPLLSNLGQRRLTIHLHTTTVLSVIRPDIHPCLPSGGDPSRIFYQ